MLYEIDYQAMGGDDNTSPWHDRASIIIVAPTKAKAVARLKARIKDEEPTVKRISIDNITEVL